MLKRINKINRNDLRLRLILSPAYQNGYDEDRIDLYEQWVDVIENRNPVSVLSRLEDFNRSGSIGL